MEARRPTTCSRPPPAVRPRPVPPRSASGWPPGCWTRSCSAPSPRRPVSRSASGPWTTSTTKIDAAKLSGETVTVWLLDGTTSVLPRHRPRRPARSRESSTRRCPPSSGGGPWARSCCGLDVRDIEGHDAAGLRCRPAPLAGLQRPRAARRRCGRRRVVPVRQALAAVLARQGGAHVRRGLSPTGRRYPHRRYSSCRCSHGRHPAAVAPTPDGRSPDAEPGAFAVDSGA